MRHFPIFLDLQGRRVLVVGSGEAADRKAAQLREVGADVLCRPGFVLDDLAGVALAIGAEAPMADLQMLSAAAQARGIPVNVVDKPDLCSYISPSIVDREPITIAVSSSGAAPILARMIRAKIEAYIPPAWGRLAAMAERFKTRIRTLLPNTQVRRRVLEELFTGPAADLIFAGRDEEADAFFAAGLEAGAANQELHKGIVFLVGAGPGAGDLMTMRAQRLLGEADVIVHDRLVGDGVLGMARRDAERIYVGKQRAHHCLQQHEINALLVQLAREGRKVVRLKGGDPFIFGRGGEEAEALAAAGVPFEVIPGVTAALACAAQARIPLTHRESTRSVTFITGHSKDGRLEIDFDSLVKLNGTIAVYMGIVTLPLLRDGLFAHGLPRQTPAMLVERGGTAMQRELHGTLDSLVQDGPSWSDGGATLVLIGDAVGRGIAWDAE